MKHLFLPYELALLVKQKGFTGDSISWYNPNGVFMWKFLCASEDDDYTVSALDILKHKNEKYTEAPTYQQIFDWLLKEHGIWITFEHYDHCEPTDKLPIGFSFYIQVWGHCEYGRDESVKNGYFKTQYEAYNKAIEEALKLE